MKPGVNVSYCLFRIDAALIAAKKMGVASILLIAQLPAFADQFDTVNYIANVGTNFDDNIFRLPAGVDPKILLGKSSKSDMTRFISAGLNIDKKYSNQEAVFNAIWTDYKYNNFSSLNYASSSFKGAWNWQVNPRLSGALNGARAQTLNNPADSRVYTRNLNTVDNISLNGDWWAHSRWHLLFGVSNGQATNSINTINYPSSRNKTNEWGLKYEHAEGKSVSLISRNLRGINFNQAPDPVTLADTGSTEKQLELRTAWQITGKSLLSGSLMKIDHRNFHFHQRDYSGIQGDINYFLGISGKSSFNISMRRSLNSWADLASSYYVANSIAITPNWQLSSKTAIRMAINYQINNYLGAVAPSAIARNDVVQSVLVGMDWALRRSVTLSASVQHGKRTSTPESYSGLGYVYNNASLSLQAYF